jgi:hypothetical protein
VVLARVVGSMTEFKQMIGRGTRVRDDYGKLWFNIIDYTGSATRLFADPAFDGDPVRVTEEEIARDGEVKAVHETMAPWYVTTEAETDSEITEPPTEERRKLYFDGGRVEIAAHLVYELDPDGRQLRVVRYTDYAAEKVRLLCPTAPALRARWADPVKRSEIIEKLRSAASTSPSWPTWPASRGRSLRSPVPPGLQRAAAHSARAGATPSRDQQELVRSLRARGAPGAGGIAGEVRRAR